jgi:hypothetical protein
LIRRISESLLIKGYQARLRAGSTPGPWIRPMTAQAASDATTHPARNPPTHPAYLSATRSGPWRPDSHLCSTSEAAGGARRHRSGPKNLPAAKSPPHVPVPSYQSGIRSVQTPDRPSPAHRRSGGTREVGRIARRSGSPGWLRGRPAFLPVLGTMVHTTTRLGVLINIFMT